MTCARRRRTASGGVWGGEEARRLGLIDEVATLDQVLRARWPQLKPHDFGPGTVAMPFAQAAGHWFGQALGAAIAAMPTLR